MMDKRSAGYCTKLSARVWCVPSVGAARAAQGPAHWPSPAWSLHCTLQSPVNTPAAGTLTFIYTFRTRIIAIIYSFYLQLFSSYFSLRHLLHLWP